MEALWIILLAGGITWVELMRRKDKAMLFTKINELQSELGVDEIKREVDPATQTEEQIISESINMEEELRRITEEKLHYKNKLSDTRSSDVSNTKEGEMMLKQTEDDYDTAF